MPDKRPQEPRVETKKKAERQPYEKPRIVYREPVEAMATTCGSGISKSIQQACETVGS